MKNLMLPLTDLSQVYDARNELKNIRYIIGDPIQYRFDGNTGIFRIGERNELTRQGESLKMHCMGFRIFKGRPFEQYKEVEIWTELYFLTQSMGVACLLLRGASAIDFNRSVYYWGASPMDTLLELRPIQRFSKEHGKQYWIVEPQFTLHTEAEQAICEQLRDTLNCLYRTGLVSPQDDILVEHNIYGCPFTIQLAGSGIKKELENADPFATEEPPLEIVGNTKGMKKVA